MRDRDELAQALGDVLVAAGVVVDQPLTGPELLTAARDYAGHLRSVRHNAAGDRSVRHERRKPLTPRERAVLDYLTVYLIQHVYPPSHREIGDQVGLRSTSSVAFVLRALEGKGYITRGSHGSARTIGVIP